MLAGRRAATVAVIAALMALSLPVARSSAEPYWIVPGFESRPPAGPQAALGLVIWNHGLKGKEDQYKAPPPPFVEGLAARGWDVVKLNRDPLYENTWSNAGKAHVRRLIAEVNAARDRGYQRVVIGGQSYGGAISLEAARTTPGLFAVIATAPGTGQSLDANGRPTDKWSHAIVEQTYEMLAEITTPRVVLVFPASDEYVSIPRGATARKILGERGTLPFVLIDETSGQTGHGAASRSAFRRFGTCIGWFLDPGLLPAKGEFRCGRDEGDLVGRKIGLATIKGATWFGYFKENGQEVMVTTTPMGSDRVAIQYGWGPGLTHGFKPGVSRLEGHPADTGLDFALRSGGSAILRREADDRAVLTLTKPEGPSLTAELVRID